MIAQRDATVPVQPAAVSDQYLVAFGQSGGLGCFTIAEAMELARGDQVILRTARGLEFGEVRGPATLRQARLIGALAAGEILRQASADDVAVRQRLRGRADELVASTSGRSEVVSLGIQILDAEILIDGRQAIVQFLGGEVDLTRLAQALTGEFGLEIRFENLAGAHSHDTDETVHGGCGKPDCGKTGDGGGCTSCGTGGGCGTCGSGDVDLRAYFGHLRTKMEETHRIPLAST